MKKLGLISLLALATAQAASAQVPTDIKADVDPAKSLGTTVTAAGRTFTIDGGRLSGANLFHSFSNFDLGQGDTAAWVHSAGDPSSISNIVNRVTGGNPSNIFGTIDSTAIPNADFFFINPAGIVFGAGAQVNVPAAAHFSTASSLRFADGAEFAISTPGGSTLSMAAPQAFGFVAGAGAIRVENAEEGFVSEGSTLTLSASDIAVEASSFEAGGLSLFAVGAEGAEMNLSSGPQGSLAGSISLTDSFIDLRPTASASGSVRIIGGDLFLDGSDVIAFGGDDQAGGSVTLTANSAAFTRQAFLGTSTRTGHAAGAVTVTVGDLDLRGRSQIFSRSRSDGRSGLVSVAADTLSLNRSFIFSDIEGAGSSGGVDIAAGSLSLFRSLITANSSSDSSGNAGDIRIVAGDAELLTFSSINSDTGGTGTGGAISLQAGTLRLAGESNITADTLSGSEGAGGRIEIIADELVAEEESFITADTFGKGDAGTVTITAGEMRLDTGAFVASNALPDSGGNSGSVGIRADRLTLLAGSRVSASTFSMGDAGDVSIEAGELTLDGFSRIVSQANPDSTGDAGLILIEAGRLQVLNESEIATSTFSSGDAGLLSIVAEEVVADGEVFIGSNANRDSTGNAGVVTVEAGSLTLLNGSRLATTTFGEGNAGAILVEAGTVRLEGSSFITSSATEESTGNAGGIGITADLVEVLSESEIASSTFSVGDAGLVSIQAGELVIGGQAFVGSNANEGSTGAAGLVTIDVGTLRIFDRGRIASSTFGEGRAGDIFIAAGLMDLDAAFIGSTANVGSSGDAGTITIAADELIAANDTRITSDTSSVGLGGDVTVAARRIELNDSAIRSTARTGSTGNAGTVTVAATEELIASNGSQINSDTFGKGGAGDVEVTAVTLKLFDDSFISSDTLGPGAGGSVSVMATDMVVASGSSVSSNATVCGDNSCSATGSAGIVAVEADTLLLTGGGRIASDTLSAGDAGLVIVTARELTIEDEGRISSESRGCADGTCVPTGDAGGVLVTADFATLRSGGQISSSTEGAGEAGLVFVRGGEFILESGAGIQSLARPGSAGAAGSVDIELTSAFRAADGTLVSSSTSGAGDAGDVSITAPLIELGPGASISSASLACPDGSCLATGDAGFITLSADQLVLDGSSVTSSTAGQGDAGFVQIRAGTVEMIGGEVSSRAAEGSTGSAGQVLIEASSINLSAAAVISSDTGGSGDAGGVDITAGDLVVQDEARISSSTTSTGSAGSIDIDAQSILVAEGGSIRSETTGAGDAGFITIKAGDILVDRGRIATSAAEGSSGNAGEVDITATSLALINEARVVSDTESTGKAGGVTVNAEDVTVASGSRLSSDSNLMCMGEVCEDGEPVGGDAGQVTIAAKRVLILGGSDFPTFVSSDTFGAGNAGNVTVVATERLLVRDAILSSDTYGEGRGGTVSVETPTVLVDGGQISSSAFEGVTGPGGSVEINANSVQVLNGGSILSQTFGTGDAGSVVIDAGDLSVSGANEFEASRVSSSTSAEGNAGLVAIQAGTLRLSDGGSILSESSGIGSAGDIVLAAGSLTMSGGEISSSALEGSFGDAGEVEITAGTVTLDLSARIGSRAERFSEGDAGVVSVTANTLSARNGSSVTSSTAGLGDAGNVTLEVGTIQLDSGANIASQSEQPESGQAGFVRIVDAQTLRLDNGAFISSSTFSAGDAGGVLIDARTVALNRGAVIASQAGRGSMGEAGLVEIEANSVTVEGGSSINTATFSNRTSPEEGSGAVGIFADTVSVTGGGIISSNTFSSDNAGVVLILARQVTVDGGSISSAAREGSTGLSGDVAVEARERLSISNGGSIETTSANNRSAGRLAIRAGDLRVEGADSEITSSNSSSQGAAGQIEIVQLNTMPGGGITLSEGASITTSARGGEAGSIDITMAPGSILRLNGRNATSRIDTSSTGGGSGGQVTIGNPDTGVGNPFAVVLNGGTITALGGLDAAFLSVNADYIIRSADRFNAIRIGDNQEVALGEYDVSSGITSKDVSVIDASRVLKGQCPAARASGQLSQFNFQQVGPYATEPPPGPPAPPAGLPEGGCL